ncbi:MULTISPECIES: hypothetical protein [unclassified Bacillus (in: firmicutes)]|uniref:hypothetical protein n=1 Tax=unclassified Bacillus (in: firmicutes) TaxID=185979 RepID=UPI0008E354D9|nr:MULTISPECIES: hypothetical protein [unclassified Bacillus (in: firmicutes)]SFB12255.1 hypothetical protein SAMN02799634_10690 [Bacillus sp. UNCCL13]SFQ90309.1 hypothetical protein SAMN04488577_3727 [Bacillus sp. cl95]
MQQQPMMNAQNQQHIMQQPPQVVTTKDSLYLTDMLSWNLLAMKKSHFFAEHCQDQQLKAAMEACGQMHQRHYQTILGHLNTTPQQQTNTYS